MANETRIWAGGPSQIRNLGYFLICGLFCFLVVPVFMGLWRWLQTRCTRYELTTERLVFSSGVLSKTTDQVELYRIRDYRLEQPLFLRLFGLSNVILVGTDRTDEVIVLEAVKDGAGIVSSTRQCVEELRRLKPRII